MDNQYDAIIVGAGHNGLTAAGYLGKAGFKTLVLERRPIVGGIETRLLKRFGIWKHKQADFVAVLDDDSDGLENDQDNCPQDANASQVDTDGDGQGELAPAGERRHGGVLLLVRTRPGRARRQA